MSNKLERSGLVPRLRFPEFREAWGWEKKELRKVAAILNKKAGSNKYRLMSITAGVGLVSQLEKFGREIAGAQYKNYLVIEKNDFAYNKSATKEYPEGFIGMYSGNEPGAVPNSIFTCFRVDANAVSPKYLDYLFIVNLHGKWLKKFLTVGARAHGSLNIDDNDLLALPVPFPQGDQSLIEQNKIADCLASLDELLTLEAQKLDTLKTHKKGLVQQLFPAEGETLPKLRFPKFWDAGGWEEKSVGDFGEVVTGSTPSTVRPEFYGGGIPFVSPTDISDLRFVNGTKTTLTDLGFDETRPIKANSVLFVCIGSTIGKVTQNVRDCATNQQINSVIPYAEHSGGFVYYILSQNAGRIANLAGKQAVPIINKTQFSLVRLPVPKLGEQERIADCLASLDNLITAQTQKLATLKTHKKGLMQQLFPALDEAAV